VFTTGDVFRVASRLEMATEAKGAGVGAINGG
jgi:hypothetical protein